MGKIGIAATKYIIRAKLTATGVVEKPDVIGAVFGQTEGLLGEELELRELQKSGRIGRIEVEVTSSEGKSEGMIEIPTSLNKEDTALIAAALETIERIGPCDSQIKVLSVDDVRATKRDYVIERAKSLLGVMSKESPESQELTELVKEKVRIAEIAEYGEDKLPAGPDIDSAEEIILVEGRADVLNLMKHGIMNIVGIGGTSVKTGLKDMCSKKTVTAFLDGDRGGDLILKELLQIADIDFVARAPIGREVEELTSKEIIKALRARINREEALRLFEKPESFQKTEPYQRKVRTLPQNRKTSSYGTQRTGQRLLTKPRMVFMKEFPGLLKAASSLGRTEQAALLKNEAGNFKEIGRIPRSDISDVLKNLQPGKADALVLDSEIDQSLVNEATSKGIKFLIVGKKPRMLKRKPGTYVLEANYLRRVVEENEKVAKGVNKNDART